MRAAWVIGALSVVGCSAPRYVELPAGDYFCEAHAVTDTCESGVASTSMTVRIDGAGTDLIYVPAPSATSLGGGAWLPIGFGAGPSPNDHSESSSGTCGGATFSYSLRARITALSTAHVELDVAYDYVGVNACGYPGVTVAACRVDYQLACSGL